MSSMNKREVPRQRTRRGQCWSQRGTLATRWPGGGPDPLTLPDRSSMLAR